MKGMFNIISFTITALTATAVLVGFSLEAPIAILIPIAILGMIAALSPRVVREWERGIVLRLGRFQRVLEPGINWVLPGVDTIVDRVDMRVRSTKFAAEKTLTRDTVPINVDAVLFWVVTDAEKAILEVEGYRDTIGWLAQTTLRDVIGKTELVGLISDRESLDEEMRGIIDGKTSEWGITVQSVEIRDVAIPGDLEDAMSRKAQAEREREARIILSESEVRVAEQMADASKIYDRDKTAMQLRAMNMTYESVKEKGALMVIPSEMAGSTSLHGIMGIAGMTVAPPEGA